MARELTFKVGEKQFSAEPTKIERKKLYGWTEILALDDSGNECKLVSMDESGTLVIPKGGVGLGILSPDGEWVPRSELQAVHLDGTPAELIPSSYSIEIELKEKVSPEVFLDYSIKSFYQLDNLSEELIELIGDDIYNFKYNYRDGFEGDDAFLLTADDTDANKRLYMMIGVLNNFEMLSLTETAVIEETPEEEEEEDAEIDFSMF